MQTFAGLYIDIDKYQEKYGNFSTNMWVNLKILSARCQQYALGVPQQLDMNNLDPLPQHTPSNTFIRAIIIILPAHIIDAFNRLTDKNVFVSHLSDGSLLQQSLGHCYITWDKNLTKDICGIWDLCLHEKYLGKGGYGKIFIETVLDTLMFNLPNETTIWLGIDLRNKYFSKVAYLYSSFGFKNPYISVKDPFGVNYEKYLPIGFLGMSRKNDYIDPDTVPTEKTVISIMYVLHQFLKYNNLSMPDRPKVTEINISNPFLAQECTISCFFNKSVAKWLQKLPLNASTVNNDGSVTQKEIGGGFTIKEPIITKNNEIFWQIFFDKKKPKSNNNPISAEWVPARYNFHTHPRETYEIYSKKIGYPVLIGYPSGTDYMLILDNILIGELVFHCVLALEGVYIISLNNYWTERNNYKLLKDMLQNLKPNTRDRENAELFMEINKIIPQNMTAEQAGKFYAEFITNQHSLLSGKPPIFQCIFLTWVETINGQNFTVTYPSVAQQCFAQEKSYSFYKKYGKI
jgi:hypothetical protein